MTANYGTGRLNCDSTQKIPLQMLPMVLAELVVSWLDTVEHSIVDINSLSYDASFIPCCL